MIHSPASPRRPIRKRILSTVAAAAAAMLALTSCAGANDSAADDSSELKWAIASPPRAIDMYSDFSSNSSVVGNLVHEGLVTLDNLELKPALASSWEATSPTTYVYQLRPDAKFSDGNPVTADDVAFSFNRHLAKGSTSQSVSHLKTLKNATVTGEHEVTMELTKPDATWIYNPLFAPIVEQEVVEEAGTDYGAPGEPVIGTGPYTVESFDASSGIVLKRNDSYWGEAPEFDTVNFTYISDPSALSLALGSGDIDGYFGIPVSKASQFENTKDVNIVDGDSLATASLMFDMDTKPFDDIHVRKAFAHAWDAKDFADNVLGGHATPANAIASPGFWKTLADEDEVEEIYDSIPTHKFDMAKAEQELAQSSVPNGFETSISYPDARPALGQALQVLAENMGKIGVTLNVKEIPYQQWVSLISAHKDLGIQIAQWNPDFPDPSNLIVSQYPSSHAVKNQYNLSNYRNPVVDDLIDKELAATDPQERITDLTEILQTVAKDVPNLNLYWPRSLMAMRAPYTYNDYNGMYYSEKWVYNISK